MCKSPKTCPKILHLKRFLHEYMMNCGIRNKCKLKLSWHNEYVLSLFKQASRICPSMKHSSWKRTNFINSESDGEEVGPHLALFPPVLLHQSHHEGAAHLVLLGVIVLLTQTEAVLRIGPESVCRTFSKYFQLEYLASIHHCCYFGTLYNFWF